MYKGTPKEFDRSGPRAPIPMPMLRFDAALDVIWIAPKLAR